MRARTRTRQWGLWASRIWRIVDVPQESSSLTIVDWKWFNARGGKDLAVARVKAAPRSVRKSIQISPGRRYLLFKEVARIVGTGVDGSRVEAVMALSRAVKFVAVRLCQKIRPRDVPASTPLMS
jgi:hypothetical protein